MFTVRERCERFVKSASVIWRLLQNACKWSVGCGREAGWKKGDLFRGSTSPILVIHQSEKGVGTLFEQTTACTDQLKQEIFDDQGGRAVDICIPILPKRNMVGIT